MSQSLTAAEVGGLASVTERRASRLISPSAVFGWWQERQFVRSIDRLSAALRHLPQGEIESASIDALRDICEKVHVIVGHIEAFVAAHGHSSLKRVERDRHLVTRIYELRDTCEQLWRGQAHRNNS